MSRHDEKDCAVDFPLPLERAERGTAAAKEEPTSAAARLTFRGEPIAWLTVPTTKTVVTANAFGDSEASERPGRRNHFILYGDNQYKREEFYGNVF